MGTRTVSSICFIFQRTTGPTHMCSSHKKRKEKSPLQAQNITRMGNSYVGGRCRVNLSPNERGTETKGKKITKKKVIWYCYTFATHRNESMCSRQTNCRRK